MNTLQTLLLIYSKGDLAKKLNIAACTLSFKLAGTNGLTRKQRARVDELRIETAEMCENIAQALRNPIDLSLDTFQTPVSKRAKRLVKYIDKFHYCYVIKDNNLITLLDNENAPIACAEANQFTIY
jgi:hypothetical protein